MSAHNFWDNFTFGFVNGMFNNNPFFGGCMNNFNFFPSFNSCFTSIFQPFSFPSPMYMFPNVMSQLNFYPYTQTSSPPSPWNMQVDSNQLFPANKWQTNNVSDNFNFSGIDTFERSTNVTSRNYSDTDTSSQTDDADSLKKKWQKKKPNLTQGFYNKVVQISKRINCSPDDLMALMNSESGINPSKYNSAGSGAVGLIQFMPATAKGLGTSTQALAKMSAEEQLVYVEKCIMNSKKAAKLGNSRVGPGTLYALIFLPARANRDILTTSGEKYYAQNKGLDRDHDGKISKADLANRIDSCRA